MINSYFNNTNLTNNNKASLTDAVDTNLSVNLKLPQPGKNLVTRFYSTLRFQYETKILSFAHNKLLEISTNQFD